MSSRQSRVVLHYGQVVFANTGKRPFSSTAIFCRYGPVPKFKEASSPELQAIITELRLKWMLPAHLAKRQRDLILKGKKRKELEAEPVIVNVQGEEFQLRPIAPGEQPSRARSLMNATKLMEPRDWESLPNLLTGLKNSGYVAGQNTPDSSMVKIIKRAAAAGRLDVILECVRRGSHTGITLSNDHMVQQLFFQLHKKALDNDQTLEDITKTLSWAEQIAEIMNNPKVATVVNPESSKDLRSSPIIIGILLQISALRSAKFCGYGDDGGKVLDYSKKLLGSSLPFNVTSIEEHFLNDDVRVKLENLNAGNAAKAQKYRDDIVQSHLCDTLREHIPVLHGMKLAARILQPESDTIKGLQKQIEKLEPELLSQQEALAPFGAERGHSRWTFEYAKRLLGSDSLVYEQSISSSSPSEFSVSEQLDSVSSNSETSELPETPEAKDQSQTSL